MIKGLGTKHWEERMATELVCLVWRKEDEEVAAGPPSLTYLKGHRVGASADLFPPPQRNGTPNPGIQISKGRF